MKRTVLILAILPIIGLVNAQNLTFGPNSANTSSIKPLNDIGLVVNQEAISRAQLANELQSTKEMLPKEMRESVPNLQQALLERVIMRHLVDQLASRAKLQLTDEEINEGVQAVANQNKMSVKQLYAKVEKDTGMSAVQYRAFLTQQIIQDRLKEMVVGNDIHITKSQIDDQLAQVARQQGSTLHLQDLLVPVPNMPVDQRGPQMNKILSEISSALKNHNDDLSQVSSSVKGVQFRDLGDVNIAQIPARFARAVVGLKTGQILNAPVVDADGMHFLKVVNKKSADKKSSYVIPEARLAHILILNNRQNPNAAKQEIDKIYTALQQGADFAELARRYSQDPGSAVKGGELGWMSVDSVDPRFAKQMQEIPLNQISAPFESAFGWHIIRIYERRDVDRSEDMIREQIRNSLYQSALQDAWEQKLLEIRQNAYIDIR